MKRVQLQGPVTGIIVRVKTAFGLDSYTLDNGYSWDDSAGRWKEGDKVTVSPFIMGTVKVVAA